MQRSLILINSLFSTLNSLPTQAESNHVAKRDTGIGEDKNFYGSWDWFIDQIAKENSQAEPTESVTTTTRPTTTRPQIAPRARSFQPRSMSRFGSEFGSKVQEKSEQNLLADKFAWFSGRSKPTPTPKPIEIQSRSGFFDTFGLARNNRKNLDELLDVRTPLTEVQFLPNSERTAIMYNAFDEGGSGDDSYQQERYTSFEIERKKNKDKPIRNFQSEMSNLQANYNQAQSNYNPSSYDSGYDEYEKPNANMFTFHTHVPNTYYDSYSDSYAPSRVQDNTLLPVMLTQQWPSNDNALGGAIFEVMNFIFGNSGTCFIRLPVAVYWFHVFNAHIDPTESDPSSGTYALIAANQAFEGVSTLDFIVNFIGDDYRFDAADIELSCDSSNTWTTSLLSFPGNTLGDVGRSNVRAVDGFEGKKVVIQFIYDVDNFHVDDPRLTVTPSTGSGNTFTISDLSGTYLEEVWFGWNYLPGGWFSAADVLVGYFDQN